MTPPPTAGTADRPAHARLPHKTASRDSHSQRKSVCCGLPRHRLAPADCISSPHDYLTVHQAPQMTKLLSAIAYQFWLWLRSPNPMSGKLQEGALSTNRGEEAKERSRRGASERNDRRRELDGLRN